MFQAQRFRGTCQGVGLFMLAFALVACGDTGGAGTAEATLTVTKAGAGSGTVTGSDINCGDDCTGSYAEGTDVVLRATPDSGSTFAGWGGACSGETCEVTMDDNKTVTATFAVQEPQGKELSGTATGWTGQDAVVRAETYSPDYLILADSPVGADGSFSLTLPGAEGLGAALYTLTGDSLCETDEGTATGTVETTPTQIELADASLWVYPSSAPPTDDEGYLGLFYYGSEDSPVEVSQLYAASDASIQGSCTFTGTHEDPDTGEDVNYTEIVTYDLSLIAGWNDVIQTFGETEEGALTFDLSTGDVPAGLTWQYVDLVTDEPLPPCEDPDDPGCEPVRELSAKSALGRLISPRTFR